MKTNRISIFFFVLFSLFQLPSFGQEMLIEEQLLDEMRALKQRQRELRTENNVLKNRLDKIQKMASKNHGTIDSLKLQIAAINEELLTTNDRLSDRINNTNNDLTYTEGNIMKSMKAGWVYFCIGFLALLVLSLILFFLSRHRQSKNFAMIEDIRKVQDKLQEESVKLDQKMLEYFETAQLRSGNEVDHTLAMKVADEVIRIEMNLFRMDKNVKGYKQLSKAVERIKNNFSAQGYDLVDMLGMQYDEGMRINADFVIDESLPEGSRIITSITKPQINFHGKMIQKAIVTVSQNI